MGEQKGLPGNPTDALKPRTVHSGLGSKPKTLMILLQVHLRKPCYDFYYVDLKVVLPTVFASAIEADTGWYMLERTPTRIGIFYYFNNILQSAS